MSITVRPLASRLFALTLAANKQATAFEFGAATAACIRDCPPHTVFKHALAMISIRMIASRPSLAATWMGDRTGAVVLSVIGDTPLALNGLHTALQ